MEKSKVTIIIPFMNSCDERYENICFLIDSLSKTNIPVIVSEQISTISILKNYISKSNYNNISHIEYKTKKSLINKSLLVNKASILANTEYIWQLDADVILPWNTIYNLIKDQPIIKPFDFIIKLKKEDSIWYKKNKKIKFNKGDVCETTSKFGPLSFILKKEVYEKERGMNEDFEGWGWEDLEFAKRLQNNYEYETFFDIRGIHLWHPDAVSNEKENFKILNDESTKNTIPQKYKLMNKYVDIKEKENTIDGKISLKNLSIVIPIRIDTFDRLNNLNVVLNYFKVFFKDYELIVIEHDSEKKAESLVKKYNCDYVFKYNKGSFYKTYSFNCAISITKNEYVLAYDCDVIFNPNAIYNALQRLIKNNTKFIYPYNTYMIQIKKNKFTPNQYDTFKFIKSLPLVNKINKKLEDGFEILYGNESWDTTGGAIMFVKKEFFAIGGYNPNIISYGCEDNEFDIRIKKMGYDIERLNDYNCYHLEHSRSTNSHYNNFFNNNEREFQKIKNMDVDSLKEYVDNGFKSTFFDVQKELLIINDDNEYSISFKKSCEKQDLSDIDIIIPTFIDSDDRLRNLHTLIKYLETYFINYKIYLIEYESEKCRQFYVNKNIEYVHYQETYNKTKTINTGIDKCTRKYVSIWDVDALITPNGVVDAINQLRNGNSHIAYPYNGWFIDVRGNKLERLINSLNFENLPVYPDNMSNNKDYSIRFSTRNQLSGGGNNGGCVLFNRNTLIQLGKYNENFNQWGFEDDEIEIRFEIMGYKRYNSINSNCYHMDHIRSIEENGKGEEYIKVNQNEYEYVKSLDKKLLSEYISSNFIKTINSIAVIIDIECDESYIQSLCNNSFINNIYVNKNYNINNNKLKIYNKDDMTYRGITLYEFIHDDIIVYNLEEKDILSIKELLISERRVVVNKNNKTYAYRTEYHTSIQNNKLYNFNIKTLNEKKFKCTILLTLWITNTLMTQEWIDRFKSWKNEEYEILAIIHDESVMHRMYVDWCVSNKYIDKVFYAEPKHGHIPGLAFLTDYISSDVVFIINNDVLVSKPLVDWCVENINNVNVGAIGWHYDNLTEGTFWNDNKLEYSNRSISPLLTEKEINKLESAPWYKGRVLKAVGSHKRILLPNGSFLCTKTSLWKELNGYGFHFDDHYFNDDWYCYGLLEKGYNLLNIKKEWANSSHPEIFLSKTDYPWKGKEDPSLRKDELNLEILNVNNIDTCVVKLLCENKNVTIVGERFNYFDNFNFNEIKYINEKCDVIFISDYVSDFNKIYNYLKSDGVIIFNTDLTHFADKLKNNNNIIKYYNNIGIILPNKKDRVSYKKQVNVITQAKINKIIFLTQPRVGFNNLKMILNTQDNVFIDDNIFQKDRTKISKVLEGYRTTNIDQYISSYFDLLSISTSKKYLGFRFNIWDEPNDAFKYFNKDYKLILLKRENIFNGLIDCAYAHETGKWHLTNTDNSPINIKIDVEWAETWFKTVKNTYNNWKQNLNDYLELSYEEIYNNTFDISKLVDYIGYTSYKTQKNVFERSINENNYKNIVVNYEEILKLYKEFK